MLALSAALIRRLLPYISGDRPRHEGLRTWIETGSFYVEPGSKPDSIRLGNVELRELVPFISFDYERFALSSLESLLLCLPERSRPKAIGWPVAKLYYSAFFAAHAIMRATGQAVFRIESSQAALISELADLFAPGLRFSSGTYLFEIRQTHNLAISVYLTRLSDVGGAHEQFWKSFYSFLGDIAAQVSTDNEPDATAIVGETSDVRDILAANGLSSGTWLSSIRNQVTYQHRYGVWFPFAKSPPEAVEYVNRIAPRDSSSIRRDYNASKEPLLAFCACCHLIAAMGIDLATAVGQQRAGSRFRELWNRLERGIE